MWLGISVLLVAYVISGMFSFYSLKLIQKSLSDYRKGQAIIVEASRMLLENLIQQMDLCDHGALNHGENGINKAHSFCQNALKAVDLMQEVELERETRIALSALKKKILIYEKDAVAFLEWTITDGDNSAVDAKAHEIAGKGVTLLKEARIITGSITSHHLAKIDKLNLGISRRKRLEAGIILLGFAVSVLLVTMIFDRTVMRPLGGLMTCFAMGAGGNYSTRMRENSPGEIGVLARYFNYFMDRIDNDNRKLQYEIAERKDVERRKEELLKKLNRTEHYESITVLAGGVAREIGAVLRPIVKLPEKIIQNLEGAVAGNPQSIEQLKKEIIEIGKTAERASATVDDLMSLGGLADAGKFPENINLLVDEFLVSYEFKILHEQYSAINIVKDLSPDVAKVMASPEHIMRMLNHLCLNAFEAMSSEGGTLTLRTFPAALKVETNGYETIVPGKYTVVSVGDTGRGIPAIYLGRIFDPFFTLKSDENGSKTGMGLSVVHGIIKDHAGFVDVDTEEGRGSTFYLYFPVIQEESE